MKLGLRPPLVLPYSVNCDTESTAPPTSRIDRLSLPCSSSKIRRCAIFSASVFASASVSSVDTPSSTAYPCPIWAISSLSTFTPARTTRCTTARIPLLRRGSPRQFKPGLPDSPCDEVTDELSGHGSQRDPLPFVPGRHKKSVRPGPSDDRPAQGRIGAKPDHDARRPHLCQRGNEPCRPLFHSLGEVGVDRAVLSFELAAATDQAGSIAAGLHDGPQPLRIRLRRPADIEIAGLEQRAPNRRRRHREQVPAPGGHRDLDTDQAANGGRPHPPGAHPTARGGSFPGNHDVRDAPGFYTDRCNRTAGEHFPAAGPGGRDDRLTYLRRLRGGLIGAIRAAGKISCGFRLQIYECSTIQQLNCCPARGRGLDLVPQPVELRGRRGKHHPAGAVHEHAGLRRQSDRKSTRLNSSHVRISYAVFCLKKKKT